MADEPRNPAERDPEQAVARLRDADPAAGAEPDAERLAALTSQRRHDELTARRERRPGRWVAVAAVTAGALVVGGASFGLGRASVETDDGGDVAVADVPAIGLDRMAGAEASTGWAEPFFSGPVGLGGRTTFTAQGLGAQGGTAEGWAFDGAATFSSDTAARAAEVLGVDGEPRQEEGAGWFVGTTDGSGPTLHLMPDGSTTLSYHDPGLYGLIEDVAPMPLPMPAPDGDAADTAVEPGAAGSAAGGGSAGSAGDGRVPDGAVTARPAPTADVAEPAPDVGEPQPTAVEPEPQPTDVQPVEPVEPAEPDEPIAVEPDGEAPEGPAGVLYETLAALGLDAEAAEYETQDHWGGEDATVVLAHQVVDGRRTSHSWHADVVDGEIYSFNGPLAPLVSLGEYDVVSPTGAVERLGDPRFGANVQTTATPELLGIACRAWGDPPAAPPQPGAAIDWPVTEVTISAAELNLMSLTTDDGVALLVPAYALSDGDGATWLVPAPADHELAF